ncbi:MAG: ABC transporter ATP-binding protein [Elusimicrobia bacterium]|nr:ABC transporter ATP-binding protein [Elusimicrobiota bacterium]
MGNILEVKNLVCGYDDKSIIKDLSFSVNDGDFIGVLGPNGSGKTTLFRALTKIIRHYKGEILLKGKNLSEISFSELARSVAVLPQFLNVIFPFTVEEYVCMGRFPYLKRFEKLGSSDMEIVEKAMVEFDVISLKEKKISELSGGERQRVFLAQAIAQQPKILLLDEPITHLDIKHQVEIMDILKNMNTNGITILSIMHDLNLASEYCNRIILIKEGRVSADGKPESVLNYKLIEDVYNTIVVVKENPISKKPYVVLVSNLPAGKQA